MDAIMMNGCVGNAESLSAGPVSVRNLQDDRRETVFDHAVSIGRMDFFSARGLTERMYKLDAWIFHTVGRWGVREYPVA